MIRAVVGLDPWFALESGEEAMASPYFGLDRNRMPILVLRRPADDSQEDMPPALDALGLTQRLFLVVPASDHGTFGDDPAILSYLGKGTPEAAVTHATIAAIVRRFLERILAVDRMPLTQAEAQRIVDDMAPAESYDAAPIPDTDGWEQLLAKQGLVETARRASELQRAYPNLPVVRERKLNALAYRRLHGNSAQLAVHLFRLNTLAHPTSANVYDSLADGCLGLRDDACVTEAYRRLLRALPADGTPATAGQGPDAR